MEDEGFVDDDFIEDAAREYIARWGIDAVPMLQERAAIAEAACDTLLAQAWRDMVAVAERVTAIVTDWDAT
ncbi:MAG TPA: hypothetical protein VME41_10420 [Stellaceae bacterium]|nr:hypothetical protein [Stellaceae bacterium]